MDREQFENILGSGDGITTGKAAEIWGCTKATARRRLGKMPDMVGTNTNAGPGQKVGKVDGRYIDEVWQHLNYENAGALRAVVDAFFPPSVSR